MEPDGIVVIPIYCKAFEIFENDKDKRATEYDILISDGCLETCPKCNSTDIKKREIRAQYSSNPKDIKINQYVVCLSCALRWYESGVIPETSEPDEIPKKNKENL